MATFKAVVLKGQVNVKGESNIKILIVHQRKTAYLRTNYYVKPSQMGKDGRVKNHPNSAYINQNIGIDILEHQKVILALGRDIEAMTAMDIKELLLKPGQGTIDFYKYADKRILELKEAGRLSYISYKDSIKRLKEYHNSGILPFKDIDKKFLESFEQHNLKAGRSINSIAIYMRSIRALFYDAMDELNRDGMEPYIKNNPWRKYKIKTEKSKKRSLALETIIKIRDAKLVDPHQEIARDMFMLQFYLIGINVKDLFYYKRPVKDRIKYKRFKTLHEYSIRIEPEARKIIDKYKGEVYLLSFADRAGIKPKKAHVRILFKFVDHRGFTKAINEKLKEVMDDLKIPDRVSTYYARHSWATLARNECNISKDDIAFCLGHKDPTKTVTDRYLKESFTIIDNANRKVMDLLKKKSRKLTTLPAQST